MVENLGIEDGLFVIEEYRKAKHALKEDKAAPDDGIVPDILKSCDADDIILHPRSQRIFNDITQIANCKSNDAGIELYNADVCNKLHIDGEKLD